MFAAKAGINKEELDTKLPRISEIPFSSEAKRMTAVHATPEGLMAYAKGAPEVILKSCTRLLGEHANVPLDSQSRDSILAVAHDMAAEALRVLGLAYKPDATLEDAEQGMIFLGMIGMIDPPTPEARVAIQQCEDAGIKPVMITGDHPITAPAIGRELALLKNGRAVAGADLESMSEEDLGREVEKIEVYARVSPTHKLRVVTGLQNKGHFVAMTDGVNDAPALKKADIGIAMGITGPDVCKKPLQ